MDTSSWAEELYIYKVIHNIQGAISNKYFEFKSFLIYLRLWQQKEHINHTN